MCIRGAKWCLLRQTDDGGHVSNIKRAVSMYGLQDAYARGRLDLGGVLRFVTDLGAGVELISDQMIKGAPHPSAETLAEWDRLVAELQPDLVCNDIFVNSTLYKNRVLRPDEQLALLKADLELSHRLGFRMVRPVSDTDADVIEAALPTAERLGIVMAMEVHAGMSYTNTFTARFIALAERTSSPWLGLTVDLGIFCERLPRVWVDYFRHLGANEDVIAWIENCYVENGDTFRVLSGGGHGMSFPEELTRLFRGPIDGEFAFFSTGYENTSLDLFDRYLPLTRHIHAKFYEMTDEGTEYSIDYPRFVGHLREVGWGGYVSSEYEGQRFVLPDQPVHDTDQVVRHQQLLQSLIEKEA